MLILLVIILFIVCIIITKILLFINKMNKKHILQKNFILHNMNLKLYF